MDILPFDPRHADDDIVAARHRIQVAALAHDRPGDPPPALGDVAGDLRGARFGERVLGWVARLDSEIAGTATLLLPDRDNDRVGGLSGAVHPGHRRRGVGTALLRAAVRAMAAEGRRSLLIESAEGSPTDPFCDAHGFATPHTEMRSILDLSTVDWTAVTRWAGGEHPGYRLVSWVGRAPDDLAASFAAAEAAMADAPLGDLDWEQTTWDARRVREYEEWARQRGSEYRVVTAVHEQTGAVAGLTSVFVSQFSPRRAGQDDTAVVPAHRGHGLGLWVKAEMLRLLREQRPDVAEIVTFNALSNVHMRRINVTLGFRPDRVWAERQGAVDDLAARLLRPAARSSTVES